MASIVLAQNQLQAQVIALQGAIIKCYQLQDLLPPAELLLQLRQASRSARTAGVNALVDMHGRIVADRDDDHATPDIPGMFPKVYFTARHPTMRDCATTSGNRGRSRSRRSKSGHGDSSSLSSRLFCPYALDLQRHLYQPLANTYHVGGSRCCPYCRFVFGTRPDKAWEIVLDDTRSGTGTKTFLIGDRFLVKCHREGGGLACVLCRRFKTHDTVCPEIADLVDHIWREHAVEEVEDDDDMREVQVT